jgi:CubicO group peptidase (beta-lactamase class C family)
MLEDMGLSQITFYAHHFADPAGGLYSTAPDLGNFCQLLLGGGVFRGRRLLSEAALRAMTSNQTGKVPVTPTEGYGVGWSVKTRDHEGPSAGSFGHRGARRTAMWIDPLHGIAMIVLIERFDMTGKEQNELYSSFFKAAIAKFSDAKQ